MAHNQHEYSFSIYKEWTSDETCAHTLAEDEKTIYHGELGT